MSAGQRSEFAMQRDHQWYRRGSHPNYPAQFHIAIEDAHGNFSPACNKTFAFLANDGVMFLLADVPIGRRCQRPACRKHWPTTGESP